jgi:hypothetical protein
MLDFTAFIEPVRWIYTEVFAIILSRYEARTPIFTGFMGFHIPTIEEFL